MTLLKEVDVSFKDRSVETVWIDSQEWDSLKNILADSQVETFMMEGKTFSKKDVKAVVGDKLGFQFFWNQDTNESISKSLVW